MNLSKTAFLLPLAVLIALFTLLLPIHLAQASTQTAFVDRGSSHLEAENSLPRQAFDCSLVSEIPPSECDVLIALYESTNGDKWSDKSDWLETSSPCAWFGVRCGLGHVTELHLQSNQLTGTIPSELGQLAKLRRLDLSDNQLTGTIPLELGQLTALVGINLAINHLEGPIPAAFSHLTDLELLALYSNQLSGTIPPLDQLTKLKHLSLGQNKLSGTIPPLDQLTDLTYLSLSTNQLTGPFPSELGQLANLEYIRLYTNQLTGTIPSELGNLANLVELTLHSNQLSGPIPSQLGQLSNLTALNLCTNQLSGPIPPELGQLSNLTALNLCSNQLSDTIPLELGNLAQLRELKLRVNQLSGTIPLALGNLASLETLELQLNQLTGTIPSELGQLPLKHLNLGRNNLSGPLPPQLGQLTELERLSLYTNQLSGPIPPELSQLTKLTYLNLQNNDFEGTVPLWLGDLTNLSKLYLDTNQLTGALPTNLSNLSLELFWFEENELCEPAEPAFQEWLSSIPDLRRTALICMPNIELSPQALSATQVTDELTPHPLTISNTGTGILDWAAFEQQRGLRLPDKPLYEPSEVGILRTAHKWLSGSDKAVAPFGQMARLARGGMTLTHSASQEITPLNSISCNTGSSTNPNRLHFDNSYMRLFDLAGEFNLNGQFDVTTVEFGVQEAMGGGGSQPVSVRLYTLNGPFVVENLTLLNSLDLNLPDQAQTMVSVPLTGTVPAGSKLVVELFTPSGLSEQNRFFIGSNHLGQTAASYLYTPTCQVDQPTDFAMLGFPNVHLVINLSGNAHCPAGDIPWATLSPSAGTTAAGDADEVTVTFDSSGLATGTYTGDLCIESNDSDEPIVTLPLTLTVESPSPSNNVVLALSPITHTTGLSATFELAIEVQAGTLQVDGASAHLNFDPTYLEVVSITPGDALPLSIINQFDNTRGEIDIAAGSFNNFPTGTFTLATVTFSTKTLTDDDGSAIEFNTTLPRQSNVTFAGNSLLDDTEGSTIFITNGTLRGAVTLQGRPAPPDPSWSVPLRVSLTIPGESTPAYSFTPTTDENGHFTLADIAPGSYEVRVKKPNSLQHMTTITLTAGHNDIINFGLLLEGDVNDDNYVTLVDFSILVTTFAKCEGDSDYNPQADFNSDNCVTILDFSLLASNFAQGGDHSPQGGAPEADASSLSQSMSRGTRDWERAGVRASLIIDQPIIHAQRGQTYRVAVRLEADSPDGAAAYINFDKTLLKVNSITAGDTFDLVLQNEFDNQTGTIAFAAGTLTPPLPLPPQNWGGLRGGGEGLGVRGELAIIELEAIGNGESPLLFQFDTPRTTDITSSGQSVLSDDVDGSSNAPTAVEVAQLAARQPLTTTWMALLVMGALLLVVRALALQVRL